VRQDFDELIPELRGWNDGAGITVRSWIGCIGQYDHAIGYSTIFWPTFTVHGEYVFLDSPSAEGIQQWVDLCQGDKREVESALNHRHLVDLFRNSSFGPNHEILEAMGFLLKDMWSCKLKIDYPSRFFEVLLDMGTEATLQDYQITIYEIIPSPL
jgi:hypothetical protein